MEEYTKLVKQGTLRADDHQTRIIQLHHQLAKYELPPLPPPSSGAKGGSLVRLLPALIITKYLHELLALQALLLKPFLLRSSGSLPV